MKAGKAVQTLESLARGLHAKGTPINSQDKQNNVSGALSFFAVGCVANFRNIIQGCKRLLEIMR